MEGMSSSKIGNKKVLHSQVREIVNRVLAFMKKEAVEGISIPLRSVHERVVAATGVSKHTLKRISKEGKDICDGLSQSFTSPRKSKSQRCSKSTVDDFDVQVIRRTTNEFLLEEKKHPTLRALLLIVRE
ncbi:hypothetical protein J437_LFUL016833 [Ladona fulva]|uniref:Uncharacterized protein n=1 Tax=Ladona fulva TaxID=123851 RepID=A0A8K0KRE9_LADFU|nr:hypothetical protein J437_LFUL016833 [Ladona fulva]